MDHDVFAIFVLSRVSFSLIDVVFRLRI